MTTSSKPKHSLEIIDRGVEHRHRYLAKCACGHPFVPLRDKGRAEDSYHAHVRAEERDAKRATVTRIKRSSRAGRGRKVRVGQQATPKPLTPHDQLPPELQ